VTDEHAVAQTFDDLFGASVSSKEPNGWPPLSCLVVNHGIFTTPSVPIWEMTLAQFERTQRINLVGPFLLIRAFLKGYKTRLSSLSSEGNQIAPPNIVIIGSTSAEFGEAGHVDYSVSKSGLTHGLMLSVKNEIVRIHPRGRINSVSPGWVATGMAEESLKDEETKWRATAT
jgi:NAD(P)-dependent dehydrogenase (short-subunit alcohol dehydrogenase family)